MWNAPRAQPWVSRDRIADRKSRCGDRTGLERALGDEGRERHQLPRSPADRHRPSGHRQRLRQRLAGGHRQRCRPHRNAQLHERRDPWGHGVTAERRHPADPCDQHRANRCDAGARYSRRRPADRHDPVLLSRCRQRPVRPIRPRRHAGRDRRRVDQARDSRVVGRDGGLGARRCGARDCRAPRSTGQRGGDRRGRSQLGVLPLGRSG